MSETYQHLNQEERCQIHALHTRGDSLRHIAISLNRSASTISRELKRNKGLRGYRPLQAHRLAKARQQTPHYSKLTRALWNRIRRYLVWFQWSPEQISGYLRIHGYAWVSHETIYQKIWADKKQGGTLYTHLRHRGKKYNKRKHANKRRGIIPNRRDIDDRPAIVEDKTRIGDWELDTVIGKGHKGALVTIVDRHSKLTLIRRIDFKTKDLTAKAINSALAGIRDNVITLTADNGREFADHQSIAETLKADFFFAKPYHSWQRGLNEHTNGLIRQYFPKSTNFTTINENEIIRVQNLLNKRPRKVLNFKQPIHVWNKLASVALQT